MQIQSAEFVISAAHPRQFLKRPIPHFVFSGKSNVGKSSLLNKLLHRKKLAKISQSPGKTRLVNYFLINDKFFFVDIPGYGYAKVSKAMRNSWGKLVDTYLKATPQITIIFQLLDIRHDPSREDRQMIEWLMGTGKPFCILLTKADKLSKNQVIKQHHHLAGEIGLPATEIIPTSAITGLGMKQIWGGIDEAFKTARNQI